MAQDVIIMPPGRPSIIGIEQLRRLSSDYHAAYEVEYAVPYDHVDAVCVLACARALASPTRTTRLVVDVGNVERLFISILRQQRADRWKFWRIIFTSPSADAAAFRFPASARP